MLIITRRAGERIMVGEDVVVEIMEIAGNSVRIRRLRVGRAAEARRAHLLASAWVDRGGVCLPGRAGYGFA